MKVAFVAPDAPKPAFIDAVVHRAAQPAWHRSAALGLPWLALVVAHA